MNNDDFRPGVDNSTPVPEDDLRETERKLAALEPKDISPLFRQRLLASAPLVRSHPFDRALRVAFPAACAACLALGFFFGSRFNTSEPQPNVTLPDISGKTIQRAANTEEALGDITSPWLLNPVHKQNQPLPGNNPGNTDLQRLSDPYRTI